jgi:hypothetical protein
MLGLHPNRKEGTMTYGLPDSAILGTAKRLARVGRRRRTGVEASGAFARAIERMVGAFFEGFREGLKEGAQR